MFKFDIKYSPATSFQEYFVLQVLIFLITFSLSEEKNRYLNQYLFYLDKIVIFFLVNIYLYVFPLSE